MIFKFKCLQSPMNLSTFSNHGFQRVTTISNSNPQYCDSSKSSWYTGHELRAVIPPPPLLLVFHCLTRELTSGYPLNFKVSFFSRSGMCCPFRLKSDKVARWVISQRGKNTTSSLFSRLFFVQSCNESVKVVQKFIWQNVKYNIKLATISCNG